MNPPLAESNIRSRWMQFLGGSDVMHRLSSMEWGTGIYDGDQRAIEEQQEYHQGGTGVTVCGRSGRMWMPGIGSRLDAPRCRQCCKGVGIPFGYGIPLNANTLDFPEHYLPAEQRDL